MWKWFKGPGRRPAANVSPYVFLALCVVAAMLRAAPASAQLSRVGNSQSVYTPTSGGATRGTDIAYDPINDIYLIVQAILHFMGRR